MASHQQTQYIHFENWSPQEVANWLKGLDESVAQYVPLFEAFRVDGKRLLMLSHCDLENMNILKLGHQELVLEAVDLLRSLRYTLETENLQSMALQLGCKARNVVAELQSRQGENDQNRANLQRREMQRKRLSITVLSYVADMLATLKNLVSWLDRAPFEGIYDICRLRNSVVKLGLEMVTVTQREANFADPEEAISKSCRTLIDCCDGLVQNTKDPLVIQPAALEQATIRKKQGEELGMNIQSAYNGIHKISSIKELSPADLCSKIEKGDEVLQVNGQTVLGWQLKELVKILKDKPKEVTLLLKKRPRHINPLGAMHNHRRLAANRAYAHAQQSSTLPKSLKKRRSREGEAKQARPSLQEFVSSADSAADNIYMKKDKGDSAEADGNDTDNDVFRSGSESPQYTLPVMPDAKQRRATVSGGSPTFEHNSLMVQDPVIRPKSQFINKAERDAALAVLAVGDSSFMAAASESGGEAERKGSEGFRMMSSDSSCGLKRPSESEVEDSVFSDKEDLQTPKLAEAEGKAQEFRVTKPTPVLMESLSSVSSMSALSKPPLTKTHSSSSSSATLSSVSSMSALSKPPLTKTHSSSSSSVTLSSVSSMSAPSKPPLTKTHSSSSSSATLSSSIILSSHPPSTIDSGGTDPDQDQSSSVKSPSTKWRPPSPVSAPPRRKKSLTSLLSGDLGSGRKGSEHSSGKAPSPLAADAVKTGVKETPSTSSTSSAADFSGSTNTSVSSVWASGGNSRQQLERQPSVDQSNFQVTGSWPGSVSRGSVSSLSGTRPAEDLASRGEKSKPLVLELTGTAPDHRPLSVQQAIQTEVAMDTPHTDAPQLMKIKKLESPTTTEAPDLTSELSAPLKIKKRVEFSPDAKESSPPLQVSYTHIVAGGVVQKIPIEQVTADSPPVKMRQKSGNRRLDRRVSCKDLGKGDCEGWLYKRKEKDHRLSKHWTKHWCVLKNFNLYYYKNKEELKAKGVIYLPAFQVSPAMDLKTKKFPFKVHNAGTTFYFASERQDDMSKWMNKMGLAAISFDTSNVVTTGGFIKPEPRSNHLGMANAYYSESEEEIDEGSSQYGSALSLNSLSSLGSATASHPSPPLFKRMLTSVSSDPGALEGKPHGTGQPKPAGAGGLKGDRTGGSRV